MTEFKAKLYGAAVKGVNHFIQPKPEIVLDVQRFSFCQSRLRHSRKPAMIQIPCSKLECGLNIYESNSVCELSEAHHTELVSGSEFYRMPVAFVALDTL